MHKIESNPAIKDCFLDHPYALGGRIIDPVTGNVSWQGKSERLRRKELEVLALLASVGGAVVTRQAFIDVVWDGNALVGDHAVSNTISSLRHALRDSQTTQPLVRTIPRRGYQLSEAAQQPVPQASPIANLAPALLAELPTAFAPGNVVPGCPGWRLVKRLGESGLSESWLAAPSEYGAEGDNTKRVFRFCRSEAYLRRLQREITLLRYVSQSLAGRVDFALIRDWQLDEPPYYLARDYAQHGSLVDWCAAGGLSTQTWPQRVALMQALAGAVAALHAVGVVHRHLRAASILVDQSDSGVQLKISAFGTGELIDRRVLEPLKITAAGLTLGVEEAVGHTQTPADDVYALGVILMQLALGDLRATDASALSRLENAELASLLGTCLGAASARPTAAALSEQLRKFGAAFDSVVAPGKAEISAASLIPVATPAPPPEVSPVPSKALAAPETIGSYHVLDRLGEGGMGTVYLAEQRAPVYRKVALKIIRAGLDGKQILSRFDAERQALAMMNHPNVAAVHESGMANDGRPFFAMEYIAGDDINSYCDAHHLSLQARVKLFLQVCDGVLHAHQKGVLHRDLKPSNLMVSAAPENAGTVKVIDFGLAKSLHGKLATHTLHTSFGAFIGTPVYSSPEHVSGSAAGVDTRSDIYSMGVVLYELLAGMTPIASESLENLEPEKVREIVCKSKLPSMREQLQNTSVEKRTALAEHRAIKVDELPKTLEGDLSWVVGKCLERDPNDRYASVLELRKDLERWLELRPVEARPTTGWYRFRKLVRRNRGVSILIAATVAALLITSVAAITGFVRAERALELSRVANVEANMAADFQVKQIQSLDPATMGIGLRSALIAAVQKRDVERGLNAEALAQAQKSSDVFLEGVNFTDLALNQLNTYTLNPALASIKSDFGAHSLLQARLWQTMADTLRKLGLWKAAVAPQALAIENRQRLLGSDDPLTLSSLHERGVLHGELGELDASAADLQAALAGRRHLLGVDAPEALKTGAELSLTLSRLGKLNEALILQRDMLAGQRRVLGNDHIDTLRSLGNYTGLLADADQDDEALRYARELLSSDRRLFGDNNADTLTAMNRLAKVLWLKGQTAEALTLITANFEGNRKLLGDQHPSTLRTMGQLALVLQQIGKMDESEAYLRALLKSQRVFLGEDNLELLNTQVNLARGLESQGRINEAEVIFREVLARRQRKSGDESPETTFAANDLSGLLSEAGKFDEATKLYTNTLAVQRRIFDADDSDTLYTMTQLAAVLTAQGQLDAARPLYQEALAAQRRTLDPDNQDLLVTISLYGTLRGAQGDLRQAETLLREALKGQRKTLGNDERDTMETIARLTQVLRRGEKLDEALSLGRELIQAAPSKFYAKSGNIGEFLIVHGKTLLALRKFDAAEQLLDKARIDLSESNNPTKQRVTMLIQAYIELYGQWRASSASAELDEKVGVWKLRLGVLNSGSAPLDALRFQRL